MERRTECKNVNRDLCCVNPDHKERRQGKNSMVLIVSILHKADGLGYLGKPQYSNVWVNLTQACYLQMGIDTCLLSQAQTAEDTLDISFDPRGFVAEQNLWFPLLEF